MNNVIPALLEYDTLRLKEKIELALQFADRIHIDIVDATFGQRSNIIDPVFFSPYTNRAFFELHMMVDNPSSYVKAYAQAGFKRFIGHVEHIHNTVEFIQKAHHANAQAFLGIDVATEASQALNFPVEHSGLHGVTVMTVRAGKSGQPFVPSMLDKISEIKRHHPKLIIEVDGGINEQTLPEAKRAGAHEFAATSSIFMTVNPKLHYQQLLTLAG